MKRFIKTYIYKKTILELAFGMCEGTSKLKKYASSMYEC